MPWYSSHAVVSGRAVQEKMLWHTFNLHAPFMQWSHKPDPFCSAAPIAFSMQQAEEEFVELQPLYMNIWNAIIESVNHTIIHRSHLLYSCCQCYLPSYFSCLIEWWLNLVSGSISDKHRSMEAPNNKFRRYQWAVTWVLHFSLLQWLVLQGMSCFTAAVVIIP